VVTAPPIRNAAADRGPAAPPLRANRVTTISGGITAAAAGMVCLAYTAYRWAALLVIAALIAGGYWELTVARFLSSRP
jgi:hypothetical protein